MIIHQGPAAIARFPRNQNAFVVFAQSIGDKVEGNPALPNPNPSIAVYKADVASLAAATTKAKDKTPANVSDRDAKALTVFKHIGHIVDYVQSVADSQTSPADAIAVILGAGLSVRKTGTHKKPELAVKYSGISGEVLLMALAIAGAGAYFWEFSVDQKVWSSVPETTKGRTMIPGLTPGQVYYFRFRALTGKGKGDYSQVVSLMVH